MSGVWEGNRRLGTAVANSDFSGLSTYGRAQGLGKRNKQSTSSRRGVCCCQCRIKVGAIDAAASDPLQK